MKQNKQQNMKKVSKSLFIKSISTTYKISSVLIKKNGSVCIFDYSGGFSSRKSWALTSRKLKKRKVNLKEIRNFLYNIIKL